MILYIKPIRWRIWWWYNVFFGGQLNYPCSCIHDSATYKCFSHPVTTSVSSFPLLTSPLPPSHPKKPCSLHTLVVGHHEYAILPASEPPRPPCSRPWVNFYSTRYSVAMFPHPLAKVWRGHGFHENAPDSLPFVLSRILCLHLMLCLIIHLHLILS